MALTKAELIKRLRDSLGGNFTTTQVHSFCDAFAALAKESLLQGEGITIQGVVTLETKIKEAHKARNPRTGEICMVDARLLPKASFNANLKLALREVKVKGSKALAKKQK